MLYKMGEKKIYVRKTFLGNCRRLLEKIVPQTTDLYKWLYLNAVRFSSKKRNERKKYLSFKYHTVDGCNLNCSGCSTFSPLVDNSFVDAKSFENDIKHITKLGYVEKMELIGGEALLHPNILELIEISRKYIEKGELSLVTNGILLLKKDEKFWESCRKNKIGIKITPYPIKLDIDKILEFAEKYDVNLGYYYGGSKIHFCKYPLNMDGRGDMNKNFNRCDSSCCATLRDGKMYICCRTYSVKFFNEYYGQEFKVLEKDYKDIYAVKDADELLDFMCKATPFCRYCDLDKSKFGIPWGITKKEIGEWI